ncbi:MAG: hypothetical protein U0795_16080 [Pirellulales bacterium]
MFYWIYDIPLHQLALWMALAFVGFSWAGVLLIRPVMRLVVLRRRGDTNSVIGSILSCYCVFYGLLLGLIAVAAYQNFSEVDANVSREAAALAALYEDVSHYREPEGQNLRWLLRDFCRYTIQDAWPKYQRGELPDGAETRLRAFHERLLSFHPESTMEEVVHQEAIRQFNSFLEQHRVREHSVTTGIPAVMWYVVLIGAVLNIALVWLFDMDLLSHLVLGGILAFFLGTVIFLIAAMDNPFRGEVSIQPEAFETLYRTRMRQ